MPFGVKLRRRNFTLQVKEHFKNCLSTYIAICWHFVRGILGYSSILWVIKPRGVGVFSFQMRCCVKVSFQQWSRASIFIHSLQYYPVHWWINSVWRYIPSECVLWRRTLFNNDHIICVCILMQSKMYVKIQIWALHGELKAFSVYVLVVKHTENSLEVTVATLNLPTAATSRLN